MARICVPYGTTEGQTATIAAYVVEVLEAHGHHARAFDIAVREHADLDGCDGVLLGASIHMSKHEKYVVEFVRRNRAALESRPSALFSVSLAALGDTAEAERYVATFEEQTGWHPTTVALVGGALLYRHYGFVKRRVMRRIARAKPGGLSTDVSRDHVYTDWDGVRQFVEDFLAAAFPETEGPDGVTARRPAPPPAAPPPS
jgi:menaquinone-dependent protoporphyrinogen oxidase